ncbi:MAG: class I SAM-dependent methyltransferase [Pirellulales bacterium]|nr:class I SAM-dependent methyltransferase [Pirellulales bacterium]
MSDTCRGLSPAILPFPIPCSLLSYQSRPADGTYSPSLTEYSDVAETLDWQNLFTREPLAVQRGVPEYVAVDDDYAENFGRQWNLFREIQLDSLSGQNESSTRFFNETGWQSEWLAGKLLLDIGCGAGRFAEIACQHGARVVAVDLSTAVYSCQETLSRFPADQYRVIRASLFDLPLRPQAFDGVYSLGVLQHTPDPLGAVRAIAEFVKPGGELATWIYESKGRGNALGNLTPKMLLRRFLIRGWTPDAVLRFSRWMVALGFPVGWGLSWLGRPGELLSHGLPYAARHHRGRGDLRRQWLYCLMDTMDWYGPTYDLPQSEADVRQAMSAAGLGDIRRLPAKGMAIVGRR